MAEWLRTNVQTFEFYVLHQVMHDSLSRTSMMPAMVAEDFSSEVHSLMFSAMKRAISISETTGIPLTSPPAVMDLITNINAAAHADGFDDDVTRQATGSIGNFLNPEYRKYWEYIPAYFEYWLGDVRVRRHSRLAQMSQVADAGRLVETLQTEINSARNAIYREEDDDLQRMASSTEIYVPNRRSTGIQALDDSMGGGIAPGECHLLFSGTGGGKTVSACQTAWHDALTGGAPLIISTEVAVPKYVVRIVSNACSIPFSKIKDFGTFDQIRQFVAANIPEKMEKLNVVLETIIAKMQIRKVSGEQGLQARGLLEAEVAIFERKFGRRPTLVILDWLGTAADASGAKTQGDRIVAWEMAATGCVKFAEDNEIATLVLAQAVNDAQLKGYLSVGDIGIAKGIAKNMVSAIGITNTIDKEAIIAMQKGDSDVQRFTKDEQFFCLAKAREGEGNMVPVMRRFGYQRFEARVK